MSETQTTSVVIVGRPNVGKSTLFNRLIGKRKALVHDRPGVTRDRNEELTTWYHQAKAYAIHLVDTGGLGGEVFEQEIDHQVRIALHQAKCVLMVFDGREGLTPDDRRVVETMRKRGVLDRLPLAAVINKIDDDAHEEMAHEFYELGFDQLFTVSAEHGRGTDLIQDWVIENFSTPIEEKEEEEDEDQSRHPRIAIVGRPNVGKSTLLNALLGRNRMITSNVAGTTVDSVDIDIQLGDNTYTFIDTAGIRRKNKTEKGIEVLSVVQARKALEKADLALLVLDGERGPHDQDEKIGGLIADSGSSVAILVNKWDVHKGNEEFDRKEAARQIREKMGFLNYAPIHFISAIKGKGIKDMDDLLQDILQQKRVKVTTSEFSSWVRRESGVHNPANAKFYLSHQSGRHPVTFTCHVNEPKKIHFSLKRHLVNAIRAKWGFMGSPIRMRFVKGHQHWKEVQKRL